jgi:hypothetical protein
MDREGMIGKGWENGIFWGNIIFQHDFATILRTWQAS